MNSYLKEIADLCGIKKWLTFHMARHTFATTVTLSNGVPREFPSSVEVFTARSELSKDLTIPVAILKLVDTRIDNIFVLTGA